MSSNTQNAAYALIEARQNAASDEYFCARHFSLDTRYGRNLFEAGYRLACRDLATAAPAAGGEESEAEQVCHEAYQAVGCMLSDLGIFETERAGKLLDNLSEARIVHDDVLPWPSEEFAAPAAQPEAMTLDEWFAEAKRIGLTTEVLAAQLSKRPEFADCLPAAQREAHRPHILESLTYHQHERDDMTLDEVLSVLSREGYTKVRGRTSRQLELQILSLLASQPEAAARLKGRAAIVEHWNNLSEDVRLHPAMAPLWEAIQRCDDARPEAPKPRPTDDQLWDQTLRERDRYHKWADKLAEAISEHTGVDIGEHSNMNCPWTQALDAFDAIPDAQAVPEVLLTALRFYARGEHYHCDESDDFDTVSGEPQNWLFHPENSTMLENGSVARLALQGVAGQWVDGGEDSTPQPIDGEVFAADRAEAPAVPAADVDTENDPLFVAGRLEDWAGSFAARGPLTQWLLKGAAMLRRLAAAPESISLAKLVVYEAGHVDEDGNSPHEPREALLILLNAARKVIAAPAVPDVSDLLVMAVEDGVIQMRQVMDADLQDALVKFAGRFAGCGVRS